MSAQLRHGECALNAQIVVGRYRVHEVIGRGGSSVVYRASNEHSPALPPVVALKVANDEPCSAANFRRQFHEQSRVSAVIDHPSVLPVIDSGDDHGRPYLVMPHVDGSDLARQLTAQALTVGRVLVLLRQVAEGLDAMHRGGVLHLDVKPSNVLVGHPVRRAAADGAPDGVRPAEGRAFLTDLGLCRFLADGPGPGRSVPGRSVPGDAVPGDAVPGDAVRGGGDFVGSPRYASPEHLRGGPVRSSSDVYSLTCLLFACLAGHPPYVGDLSAVVTGHLSGRVPSLSTLTALPRCLDRVIRRGMHPDPDSRFTSCRELVTGARLAIVDGYC